MSKEDIFPLTAQESWSILTEKAQISGNCFPYCWFQALKKLDWKKKQTKNHQNKTKKKSQTTTTKPEINTFLNLENLLDKPQDRDLPPLAATPAPHSPGHVVSVTPGHPQQRSFALPKESRHSWAGNRINNLTSTCQQNARVTALSAATGTLENSEGLATGALVVNWAGMGEAGVQLDLPGAFGAVLRRWAMLPAHAPSALVNRQTTTSWCPTGATRVRQGCCSPLVLAGGLNGVCP